MIDKCYPGTNRRSSSMENYWEIWDPTECGLLYPDDNSSEILSRESLRRVGDFVRNRWLILNMCKQEWESVDYLILHCEFARELWMMIFSMFRVVWVMPCLMIQFLVVWRGVQVLKRRHSKWDRISDLWWVTWRERNCRYFLRPGGGGIALVQINIWFWVLFFFQNEFYLGSVIALLWVHSILGCLERGSSFEEELLKLDMIPVFGGWYGRRRVVNILGVGRVVTCVDKIFVLSLIFVTWWGW